MPIENLPQRKHSFAALMPLRVHQRLTLVLTRRLPALHAYVSERHCRTLHNHVITAEEACSWKWEQGAAEHGATHLAAQLHASAPHVGGAMQPS